MNWRKQAYVPPKDQDFSHQDEAQKPKAELREDVTLKEAGEDFTLMAKVEGRAD